MLNKAPSGLQDLWGILGALVPQHLSHSDEIKPSEALQSLRDVVKSCHVSAEPPSPAGEG